MSAQRDTILDGLRHRRDFRERQWREAAARSAEAHDRYMEAEREVLRSELRRLPAMPPPVTFYSIEEAA